MIFPSEATVAWQIPMDVPRKEFLRGTFFCLAFKRFDGFPTEDTFPRWVLRKCSGSLSSMRVASLLLFQSSLSKVVCVPWEAWFCHKNKWFEPPTEEFVAWEACDVPWERVVLVAYLPPKSPPTCCEMVATECLRSRQLNSNQPPTGSNRFF